MKSISNQPEHSIAFIPSGNNHGDYNGIHTQGDENNKYRFFPACICGWQWPLNTQYIVRAMFRYQTEHLDKL
jgi:hypothetical protein